MYNMSILSSSYIDNKTKISMQFLADVIKRMIEIKILTKNDLYNLSEKQILEKIDKCEYDNISKCFKIWQNATKINEGDNYVEDKYCRSIKAKVRYIVPLVRDKDQYIRINKISKNEKQDIEKCLNYETKKYTYFDFNF